MVKDIQGIKRLPALNYPETGSFRCIEVVIPDDDKYLWVLAGFISILGNAWTWTGTRNDRISRAALWKMAYRLTEWAACMNCEEMQECLQPLFDALRQQINQDAIFRQYGTDNPTGVPLSPEVSGAPLAAGSNPTCDYDILWSQCEQLVEFSNEMITDSLELLETATNNAEAIAALTQLPIVDEFGFDALAAYAELLLDGIAENYAAAYTLAYRQQLACELFCLCRIDCNITIDRVFGVLRSRLEAYWGTPMGAVSTIGNVLSYMLDQSIDGVIVADAMMAIIWASGKYGNTFLGSVGTVQLEAVLEMAVNDANDDWTILCDCPDCGIEYTLDKGTSLPDNWEECDPPQVAPNLIDFASAGCRRGKLIFASPVTSVLIQFDCTNNGGGSGDGMVFRLGEPVLDGSDWIGWTGGEYVQTFPEQTGEIVVTSETGQTEFWFDIGYTSPGNEAPYANNNAQIKVIEACE